MRSGIFFADLEQENEMKKAVAQWERESLITFKMFPCYYPRLPHTGKKIHLQAQNDLLPLLFAFNHQNYT